MGELVLLQVRRSRAIKTEPILLIYKLKDYATKVHSQVKISVNPKICFGYISLNSLLNQNNRF